MSSKTRTPGQLIDYLIRAEIQGFWIGIVIVRDRLTPERRSWNMSRIRGKDTSPELIVRKLLHRMGYRFRLHVKNLPGKPDIVLPKYRTVIFVHGCFWHTHTRPTGRSSLE